MHTYAKPSWSANAILDVSAFLLRYLEFKMHDLSFRFS